MTSSGGLFGSSPASRSKSGISTNTKNGPKNHESVEPVQAYRPHIASGINGMMAPMSQR